MAALHDIALPPGLKDLVAKGLWAWIDANQEREVWKVKFWIVSKTFRVKDLDPVFEMLLGPHPTVATQI